MEIKIEVKEAGLCGSDLHIYNSDIAIPVRPPVVHIETICYKEIHFSGSMASRSLNWEKALKLVQSGQVRLAPLASHHLKLEDWEEAFQMFREKRGLKLMLKPQED